MGYGHSSNKQLVKERILETFKEYGGWWEADRMAEWVNAPVSLVKSIHDDLEKEGLMERKKQKVKSK